MRDEEPAMNSIHQGDEDRQCGGWPCFADRPADQYLQHGDDFHAIKLDLGVPDLGQLTQTNPNDIHPKSFKTLSKALKEASLGAQLKMMY